MEKKWRVEKKYCIFYFNIIIIILFTFPLFLFPHTYKWSINYTFPLNQPIGKSIRVVFLYKRAFLRIYYPSARNRICSHSLRGKYNYKGTTISSITNNIRIWIYNSTWDKKIRKLTREDWESTLYSAKMFYIGTSYYFCSIYKNYNF